VCGTNAGKGGWVAFSSLVYQDCMITLMAHLAAGQNALHTGADGSILLLSTLYGCETQDVT